MAIQKAVRIMVWARSDGESDSFTFDLNTSPYWVGTTGPDSVGGIIVNWFAGASPSSQIPPPVGIKVVAGGVTATLASPLVTVFVPVLEAGARYEVILDLMFA